MNEYASNQNSGGRGQFSWKKAGSERGRGREREVARMAESFKAAKMRPKRSSHQEDHIQQPADKRARIQAPRPEDDLDLGGWLQLAEARCTRDGNLKSRMEMERDSILEIMNRWKQE